MGSPPRISVIMPVFNGAHFLEEAIASILHQTHGLAEIILVDDGSTDDTSRVAAEFGSQISYLHQENQGPGAARNLGLSAATGDLISFLDVDDCWRPDKLRIQTELLLSDSNRDGVWGMCQVMNAVSHGAVEKRQFVSAGEPCRLVQLGTFLFHRRVLEQVNGFDARRYQAEDVDLITRIEESGMFLYRHDDVVMDYRRHGSNITNNVNQAKKDFLAVLKKTLDRRRSAENQ
jgi:glycosyltransferase involved in cell wall biosynthesis